MEGFLWLITQMALLLTAAAAVFLWLGWRWRSQDAIRRERELNARIDKETAAVRFAHDDRDAARLRDQLNVETQAKLEADLQEASDHRRNLERELIRVHDDLKTARRDSTLAAEDHAAAEKQSLQLSAELDLLRQEKVQLEKDLADLRARPVPEPVVSSVPVSEPDTPAPSAPVSPAVVEPEPEAAAKPKRVRKPTAAPASKPAKPSADAQATLARLDSELSAKQTLLGALTQERDDWQRRVSTLRERGNDPAGLGLAQKSLARASANVAEASTAVEHLRHQQDSLRRSLDQAATLSQEDDLTKIKGIKSVLRDQLHAFGIRSFQQIAAWTDADVEAFSELLAFKDRAKRDEWVRQARDLMGAS